MNNEMAELIKEKINKIFADYPYTPGVQELEDELKSDLYAAANDKIKTGMSIKDAVTDSFSDFGDIEDLIDQVVLEESNAESEDNVNEDVGHRAYVGKDSFKIDNGTIFTGDDQDVELDKLKLDQTGINYESNDKFKIFDSKFENNDTEIYVESLNLANEQEFSIDNLKQIYLTYRSATVRILPIRSDKVVLREYISRNNSDYYAHTSVSEETLNISQGKVPKLLPLKVRVQLLIPIDYAGDLKVSNLSGNLQVQDISGLNILQTMVNSGNGDLSRVQVKNLSVNVKSGRIKLNNTHASELLQIINNSGVVKFDELTSSQYKINVQSGTIRGEDLVGSGKIESNSGTIKLNISKLTGDIHFGSKSGTIAIGIDDGMSYKFDFQSKNGIVSVPDDVDFRHDTYDFKDGKVGNDPEYTIFAKAHSGTIKLFKK